MDVYEALHEAGGVLIYGIPSFRLPKDVVRKLVILAREAGYRVEQDDVKKNLFIPQKFFEGSLDEFWSTISELDEEF